MIAIASVRRLPALSVAVSTRVSLSPLTFLSLRTSLEEGMTRKVFALPGDSFTVLTPRFVALRLPEVRPSFRELEASTVSVARSRQP